MSVLFFFFGKPMFALVVFSTVKNGSALQNVIKFISATLQKAAASIRSAQIDGLLLIATLSGYCECFFLTKLRLYIAYIKMGI